MVRRPTQHRPALHRFAIGGAWFFIIVSLAQVLLALGVLTAGAPAAYSIYDTTVNGSVHDAVGLSYADMPGAALALLQIVAVGGAAIASMMRHDTLRRIGHGVLMAWAALWTVNLLWLTSLDQQVISYGRSLVMLTLLGCTSYRAMRGWSRRTGSGTSVRADAGDDTAAAISIDELDATDHDLTPAEIGNGAVVAELETYAEALASPKDATPGAARRSADRVRHGARLAGGAVDDAARMISSRLRALAVLIRPHVQRISVRIWTVIKAAVVTALGWLRGHGVVPQRAQPVTRAE